MPGGAVYVVDFTKESDIGPPLPHRIAPETVAEELSSAGLETELVAELDSRMADSAAMAGSGVISVRIGM